MMSKRKKIIFISIAALLTIIIALGILVSHYGFAYLRIKSVGVALKPTKVIEPFNVTYYLQNDPAWSADKLGDSSSTMGGAGCLVSSIATAIDYHGVKYNPREVNNIFRDNSVFNESGQVIWMNIKNAIPEIDYKYDRVFDTKTIEDLLDEGLLPIIEVKYKGFGISHWVVVIGSDDTDFLVMDPLNQSKTPLKLSEHGGRGFAYRVLVRTGDSSASESAIEQTPIPMEQTTSDKTALGNWKLYKWESFINGYSETLDGIDKREELYPEEIPYEWQFAMPTITLKETTFNFVIYETIYSGTWRKAKSGEEFKIFGVPTGVFEITEAIAEGEVFTSDNLEYWAPPFCYYYKADINEIIVLKDGGEGVGITDCFYFKRDQGIKP